MKRVSFYKMGIAFFLGSIFLLTSCEKYLDKAPEADISDKDVFGNFRSFQGFIEECYGAITDKNHSGSWNNYSFADERLNNYPYPFDAGNYWVSSSYLYGQNVTGSLTEEPRDRRVWEYAWYGISKANKALEMLDEEELFSGTSEERDLLRGQALFFRGFFYFEISKFWGGMPYIKKSLSPTEDLFSEEFNRLNFRETALLMAEDFKEAANILPNTWDETTPGQETLGKNQQRINKFFALGYLGKALLYAASPMINEEATGSNAYDPELAQQAAETFGELLELSDLTGIYKLQSWATWTDNFWLTNNRLPGGTEVIMGPTVYRRTRVRHSTAGATTPSSLGLNSGSDADVPTHNNTKNYRMSNGLPIDDPDSGYDPADPWKNREPRFYKDIVVDGDKITKDGGPDQFVELFNGGRHRSQINPPSVTGYYGRKFVPLGPDFTTASNMSNLQSYVPFLRLADVYLMYAEAVLYARNGGTPQSTSGNYHLTAVKAVNVVRNRAQIANLDAKFTTEKDKFFEEGILKERAVELNFEGIRFDDLRRWNLNGDPRFTQKTAIDFDRGPGGKPINIKERVVVTRVAGKAQNWLPLQNEWLNQYEGFKQNPGW